MLRKTKKSIAKLTALLLSAAIVFPVMQRITISNPVRADEGFVKSEANTTLGVSGIKKPRRPDSNTDEWLGSWVWFGKYEENPMYFKVLSTNTSEYSKDGRTTVLLDSRDILFNSSFDDTDRGSNLWDGSTLQSVLNGSFYENSFSEVEKSAIAVSYKEGGKAFQAGSYADELFGATVGLNDKIFVLDVADVINPSYGYYSNEGYLHNPHTGDWIMQPVYSRDKGPWPHATGVQPWWLRNAETGTDTAAAYVSLRGNVGSLEVTNMSEAGVAPALNIYHDSILFATQIGEPDETGYRALYFLTLIDPEIQITDTQFSHLGDKVHFTCRLAGENASKVSHISYLITSKNKDPNGPKSEDILYYGKADATGLISDQAEGSFSFPSDLDAKKWGEDYQVYLVAEDIGNIDEVSDYASDRVELKRSEMLVLFDLSDGQVDCNATQLEALDELIRLGKITVNENTSAGTLEFDIDKNGVYDLEMQTGNYILKKMKSSNFSESQKVFRQAVDPYRMIVFNWSSSTTVPRFYKAALEITEDIGVRFLVKFPSGMSTKGAYVDFVNLQTGSLGSVNISQAQYIAEEDGYCFTCRVNECSIADTIKATLHYGRNGQTVTCEYSVMEYIDYVKTHTDQYYYQVRLLEILQDYGYYMQNCKWNDGQTHAPIPGPVKALSEDDIAHYKVRLGEYETVKNLENSGISDTRMSLTFNSRMVINLYAKPEDGVNITAPRGTETQLGKDTYYKFSSKRLCPMELLDDQTFIIETDRPGRAVVTASPISYVYLVLNSDLTSITSAEKYTMIALYNFAYDATYYYYAIVRGG